MESGTCLPVCLSLPLPMIDVLSAPRASEINALETGDGRHSCSTRHDTTWCTMSEMISGALQQVAWGATGTGIMDKPRIFRISVG